MAKLKLGCPKCGAGLRGVTTDMIGDIGVCPKCRAEFEIKDESTPSRDPESPPNSVAESTDAMPAAEASSKKLPSVRYSTECSGAVFTGCLVLYFLTCYHAGRLVMPGVLPILSVGMLSAFAGSLGFAYGRLVEKFSLAATGRPDLLEPRLGLSLGVGLPIAFAAFMLHLYLYETYIARANDGFFPVFFIGLAVESIFTCLPVLVAVTLGQFARFRSMPRQFIRFRLILWTLAFTGSTLLMLGAMLVHQIHHDWRYASYGDDLSRFRAVARSTVNDALCNSSPGTGKPEIRPHLVVLDAKGWVDHPVQSQLGPLGAVNRAQIGTVVYINRNHHGKYHFACFFDWRDQRLKKLAEIDGKMDSGGIVDYLKQLPGVAGGDARNTGEPN